MRQGHARSKDYRSKVAGTRPPRSEPAEREDPLNVALDAVEQLIANIVAEGGEAPLRARLKRLLPESADGPL